MKVTIAIRLHNDDIERFNGAKFLISEIDINETPENFGVNLCNKYNSYNKVLDTIFNYGYKKIYTDDIDYFVGEFIFLYGKNDEWYVGNERPDNKVYLYDLKDYFYL